MGGWVGGGVGEEGERREKSWLVYRVDRMRF